MGKSRFLNFLRPPAKDSVNLFALPLLKRRNIMQSCARYIVGYTGVAQNLMMWSPGVGGSHDRGG